MKYTKNSLNILTTKSYKGIGNAWIVKNLKGNEDVDTIVSLINNTIKGDPTSVDEFERLRKEMSETLRISAQRLRRIIREEIERMSKLESDY